MKNILVTGGAGFIGSNLIKLLFADVKGATIVPGIADKNELWKVVLGVDENEENIFTDVNKKLKIDTAKDAKLI